jgi:hypothetical protein
LWNGNLLRNTIVVVHTGRYSGTAAVPSPRLALRVVSAGLTALLHALHVCIPKVVGGYFYCRGYTDQLYTMLVNIVIFVLKVIFKCFSFSSKVWWRVTVIVVVIRTVYA